MKVRPWLVAGLFFALLWVFVRGAGLTAHSLLTTFLVGLAVGLPVAYVFRRLYEDVIDISQLVRSVPYVLAYAAVLSKEVLVANFDVAYRVLAPGMPLEPQVILVPLRVETPLAITTIANSISITPGTVTLDHDPDENALYVHIIDGRHPENVVGPIRTWERYALTIFDEPLAPDTPAPGIRVHPPGGPPEPKTVSGPPETSSEDRTSDDETTGGRTGDETTGGRTDDETTGGGTDDELTGAEPTDDETTGGRTDDETTGRGTDNGTTRDDTTDDREDNT